jgi:two-component system response regulator PilR (NtrC family)
MNAKTADSPSAAPKAQKPSVLVVDDEVDLRDVIAFDFTRKGFLVTQASGGIEAWSKIKESPAKFDLVITDIKMPNGDGLELLTNIVAHFPKLPVICLSGFAVLSHEEILKIGARAIFAKPFDRKTFHDTVKQILGIV